MDINPLNNKGSFIDRKKAGESSSARKTDTVRSGSEATSGSANSLSTDDLSISSNGLTDEIEFSKTVLENLNKQSFENLARIKAKIANGELDTDEVREQVSRAAIGDIRFVDSAAEVEETAPARELPSLEEASRILDNNDALKTLSERLLKVLANL